MNITQQIQNLAQPCVIMAVGIPGSGKTTFIRNLIKVVDIQYISSDDIRAELAGDAADQSVNKRTWEEVSKRAKQFLADNKSVVIDATHAEAWRRPGDTNRYRTYGAKAVIALMFDTPLEVARQRNVRRERVVPDHAIQKMFTALRKEPVNVSEGFDKVIHLSD